MVISWKLWLKSVLCPRDNDPENSSRNIFSQKLEITRFSSSKERWKVSVEIFSQKKQINRKFYKNTLQLQWFPLCIAMPNYFATRPRLNHYKFKVLPQAIFAHTTYSCTAAKRGWNSVLLESFIKLRHTHVFWMKLRSLLVSECGRFILQDSRHRLSQFVRTKTAIFSIELATLLDWLRVV